MSTMMVQMVYPQNLTPLGLDQYLAGGWFRSSSLLFRTSLICIEQDVHSVVNIRLDLSQYSLKKRLRKLLSKNDKMFKVEYGFAKIDEKREFLYRQNKGRFKGFVFDSLEMFLYADNYNRTIFDTREVSVYHGDKLVAVSYFDIGEDSMASIIGLHDESYSKFSLGIYTMLKEIQFSIDADLRYFYPGYVLEGESSFDYKLKLGNYEYYNWKGSWKSFSEIDSEVLIVEKIKQKLSDLREKMDELGIPNYQYIYPLFSSGHIEFHWGDLFKSPIFVVCFEPYSGKNFIVVEYNVNTNQYQVSELSRNQRLKKMFFDISYQRNNIEDEKYIDDLLEYEEVLFNQTDASKVSDFLSELFKK